MKFQIHFKEKVYLSLMIVMSVLLYAALIAACALGYWQYVKGYVFMLGFFVLLRALGQLFFVGYLRGNAIKVTPRQFPEAYEILKAQSERLGLSKIPTMYLLQGHGVLNAFAMRSAGRNLVILYSSVLEAAYQEELSAVEFIIGHELGHIKRNHVNPMKALFLMPASMIPFLSSAYSRACEYTCDNIGYNLCSEGATKGMLILASGKALSRKVNIRELLSNARSESGVATWFAEIVATHPHVIKRIAQFDKLDQNNLTQASFVIDAEKADQRQLEH